MLKGIDVSKHQGLINWNRVKAAGVQFAMLRAGYGKNNIDTQFKRNVTECNRLGIPVGVYWFSYALSEKMAAEEAEFLLKLIKPFKIEYPVVFDLEYDTIEYAKKKGVTINKALASKMVQSFCGKVEQAGYYAMNYSNLDYIKNMFEPEIITKYDVWYARYTDKCDRTVGLWQYSSTGKVDGIEGNVDMNIDNRDYKSIITAAGLNKLQKAAKVNVTIETTLTKDELVAALTKAGYKVAGSEA